MRTGANVHLLNAYTDDQWTDIKLVFANTCCGPHIDSHTHTHAKGFTLLRAPHVGQKRPLKIYKRLAACEVFSRELSMTVTAPLHRAAMLEAASALVFSAFVFLMYDTAY